MKNSCVSEVSYLGKPENYTLIMHIMTCFEVPINLFGVYCILFKTPKKMEPVKRPLLILQVFSLIDDFLVSFIGIPYTYLPFLVGFPMGAIYFPDLECFVMLTMFGEIAAAILSIFENRYYILFGQNTYWKTARVPYLVINFLLSPITWLPVYLSLPEQEPALAVIYERMPCNPDNPQRGLWVLALDGTLFVCMSTFLLSALTIQTLVFCGILLVKMLNSNLKSSKSLDLQRKFLFALTLQVLFPLLAMVFPIAYVIVAVHINYHNQSMNNLFFCLIGSHGFLSTVIMVLVHEPYRKVVQWPIDHISPAFVRSSAPISS